MIAKALTLRASSIGDCLMGKYFLENVRAAFPEARLGLVVGSRGSMIKDLFAAYPWLEIIEANRTNPRGLHTLWNRFKGSDVVLTQYAGKPGGRFSLLSKLAGYTLSQGGALIGFEDASPWNRFFYEVLLPVHRDMSVADHDRAAVKAAGVPLALPFPRMRYLEDRTVLEKLKLTPGSYAVLHLFAGNASRGLTLDKKRLLVGALQNRFPHLVVTGGASDREEALRVVEGTQARVIAGDVTLQELMTIIDKSKIVISVDTGVAHLAAQLGKPLVVLRTCVAPNWWFPDQYGPAAPIKVLSHDAACEGGHVYGPYPPCINGVGVPEVIEAL